MAMDCPAPVKWLAFLWVFSVIVLGIYIFWNDKHLMMIPSSALRISPSRWRPEDARMLTRRVSTASASDPGTSRTGRRYIIVGGGGFLGGWIVTKLLERGERLLNIRILDINSSSNYVVKNAISDGLQFIRVDITDSGAVDAAFTSPWPQSSAEPSADRQHDLATTVFHTAANIRFFERHRVFLDKSTKVNVVGTQNVINAARKVGADVMVYSSSGSVCLHSVRLLLWPWENVPDKFVQVVNDEDGLLPKTHEDFFSNYAASKLQGESIVRLSDRLPTGDPRLNKVLRTGCLRPGNGMFGPRGDSHNCGAWLTRQYNPSFASSTVQSFCYVENGADAHLCYEARLIELQRQGGSTNPDIGGQAFAVADSGPPPTYGDMYTIMETLTDGQCTFPHLSPTLMMILAHLIEWYYRLQQFLVRKGSRFARLVPPLNGDLVNLQPSIFSLVMVHLISDDSRARLPPHQGGLGYKGRWTSVEGLCRTVEEHTSGVGRSSNGSESKAGIFMNLWRKKATEATQPLTDDFIDVIPQMLTELQ